MSTHTVRIERNRTGNFSSSSLGTDALNAVSSIPGVLSAAIIEESSKEAVVKYEWDGREDFQTTDEHLAQFHVQRIWE